MQNANEARDVIAAKIGHLTIANIELAAQNTAMAQLIKVQMAEIAELKAKLEKSAKPADNLPANPYGEGDEANGAGVH